MKNFVLTFLVCVSNAFTTSQSAYAAEWDRYSVKSMNDIELCIELKKQNDILDQHTLLGELKNRKLDCNVKDLEQFVISLEQFADADKSKFSICLKSKTYSWQLHNCFGSFKFPNENYYVGEWKNGSMHGYGTYTYGPKSKFTGDKYIGQWINGSKHGFGTYYYSNGTKYVGEWKEDKWHGKGTQTFTDGGKYVGDWNSGKAHGKGTTEWANGNKFSGDYRNNKINGRGVMKVSNGDFLNGEFKSFLEAGKEKFIFVKGYGEETLENGNKYRGFYNESKKSGHGTLIFTDGNKYVGNFKDDMFNGKGVFTYNNGQVLDGFWKDDVFLSETIPNNAPRYIVKPKVSAELTTAEREAEKLRQELATLKAQQQQQQQTISSDTQIPLITITAASTNGPQGTITGRVSDNAGVGEVRIDGKLIQIDSNGNFTSNTYVPRSGISLIIEAVDLAGLSSSMSVRLDRSVSTTNTSISFDRLNPLGRKVAKNKDALALIIGVDGYKSTPARAIYADSDAEVFTDYASQKLGIPSSRIKTLINDGAGEREMLLSVKSWLSRAVKQGKTDVYVFFAGHGLASDGGKQMYLLPYDGAPELLEKTAILREELFNDIASANPRSVTVFLDTCYSGTTRGTDMLIASRPIALKALKQNLPDNFTVLTAAAGDQTAKPLEEAKHGMFSYFLMKGMEGDADANQDNQITAGELHAYVQENVVQQSSGSQTPELQGDAERVLVQFQ